MNFSSLKKKINFYNKIQLLIEIRNAFLNNNNKRFKITEKF